MTQLELREHTVVVKGFGHYKVVAVSSSHTALVKYCKEKYGHDLSNDKYKGGTSTLFEIVPSEIAIVEAKQSKFEK
jgi:hypothetical protein